MSNVSVKNLTKVFGDNVVFSNINCEFQEGKITGLLGNNGTGKTTLLNIMTNRIFPSHGEIHVDGECVFENDNALSKIYFMSEKTLDREEEKVKNVFKKTSYLYPNMDIEYANELAEKFSLDTKKKFHKLSTGYRSIARIIIALSSMAEVLVFDEPVLGLDANHRDIFYKELLKKYERDDTTIILSTHIIE